MSIYTVNKDIVLYTAANLTNRCTAFGEGEWVSKIRILKYKAYEIRFLIFDISNLWEPGKQQKILAVIDGPKFLLSLRCIHESNIPISAGAK